jgi:CoA:oxalate CoA-transferase
MSSLSQLRVVELTHMIAGPACGQILSDFGAQVIKIEPPAGDVTRGIGPRNGDTTALFACANRGKQSVFLDIRTEEGAAAARTLVADCDVVICNLDVTMVARAGLDTVTLRKAHPELIYVDITAFGAGAPSGTDGLAQAAMGLMHMTGEPGGSSYRTGPSIVDVSTGVWGALAVMAALNERRDSNQGAHIETSLGDVCLYMQYPHLVMFDADPDVVRRNGNYSMVSCTPMLRASDGRVMVTILHQRHWEALCEVTGLLHIFCDSRFLTDVDRCRNQAVIEKVFEDAFARKSRQEWLDLLSARRIPCGPERTYPQVLEDRSLWTRGMLQGLETSSGRQLQLGLPLEVDGKRIGTARAVPISRVGETSPPGSDAASTLKHAPTISTIPGASIETI